MTIKNSIISRHLFSPLTQPPRRNLHFPSLKKRDERKKTQFSKTESQPEKGFYKRFIFILRRVMMTKHIPEDFLQAALWNVGASCFLLSTLLSATIPRGEIKLLSAGGRNNGDLHSTLVAGNYLTFASLKMAVSYD